ncbi:MAG: ABC transporter permease subunit [Ruminococcaceae bacterium]|nr:ABC transporter permease subunit [Oscillospiraceae bacterium]
MRAKAAQLTTAQKLIYRTLSVVFWTALWAFAAAIVDRELLLPSPFVTLRRLCELAVTAVFWKATLTSLLRIAVGFAVGALIGTLLAVPTALFRPADLLMSPMNTVIRATPVASFIILALVWIESGRVPSFIAVLMVTPIVWNALKTAIREVDKDLLEMADAYRLSGWKRIRFLYVPTVLPQYTASLMTALGLAWKAGIAAEVLCHPKRSIGGELYNAKIYLETPDLFAWTLTVILLSVAMEAIFGTIMTRYLGRRKSA